VTYAPGNRKTLSWEQTVLLLELTVKFRETAIGHPRIDESATRIRILSSMDEKTLRQFLVAIYSFISQPHLVKKHRKVLLLNLTRFLEDNGWSLGRPKRLLNALSIPLIDFRDIHQVAEHLYEVQKHIC
jgi:hypothetical protein